MYDAVFWNPPQQYKFKHASPKKPEAVKVYEAHGEALVASANANLG